MSLTTMILQLSEGLGKTCAIFFLTLLFSLPLGMIVALLRMSRNKIISSVTRFFINILRGTPLMLQLLAVTYGPYYLFGISVSRNKLIPVVIAFAIRFSSLDSFIMRKCGERYTCSLFVFHADTKAGNRLRLFSSSILYSRLNK